MKFHPKMSLYYFELIGQPPDQTCITLCTHNVKDLLVFIDQTIKDTNDELISNPDFNLHILQEKKDYNEKDEKIPHWESIKKISLYPYVTLICNSEDVKKNYECTFDVKGDIKFSPEIESRLEQGETFEEIGITSSFDAAKLEALFKEYPTIESPPDYIIYHHLSESFKIKIGVQD